MGYYSDTTSASGDQLPWGVASVWANGESNANGVPVDWTGDADTKIASNFSYLNQGDNLITEAGEYNLVDAGISKILLDDPANKADAKVDKFAIVIDSGVAKLDDFNIGAVSESLSMSFIDSNYNTILSDETFELDGQTTSTAFKDTVGHGTHVAGTIAAKADGKGVVGVAPGAEVISLKVFGDTGSDLTAVQQFYNTQYNVTISHADFKRYNLFSYLLSAQTWFYLMAMTDYLFDDKLYFNQLNYYGFRLPEVDFYLNL